MQAQACNAKSSFTGSVTLPILLTACMIVCVSFARHSVCIKRWKGEHIVHFLVRAHAVWVQLQPRSKLPLDNQNALLTISRKFLTSMFMYNLNLLCPSYNPLTCSMKHMYISSH